MDEDVLMALEIVKAQAGFRTMTEEEICSMLLGLSTAIRGVMVGDEAPSQSPELAAAERMPKENSILCLECMRPFKMLTYKHMATHNLTPDEYRAKWGYAKNTPLVCKSLQRLRRNKMKDIRIWERRKKAPSTEEA